MAEEFRTPEGALIYSEIQRAGLSVRSVARDVPISDTRLRDWYRGVDNKGQTATFPARQLARVAQILGLSSDQLRDADRDDAAGILDVLAKEATPMTKTYTPEEVARMIEGMAKRIGELEDEVVRIVDAHGDAHEH